MYIFSAVDEATNYLKMNSESADGDYYADSQFIDGQISRHCTIEGR